MKMKAYFLPEIKVKVTKVSSAAVLFGALRVNAAPKKWLIYASKSSEIRKRRP